MKDVRLSSVRLTVAVLLTFAGLGVRGHSSAQLDPSIRRARLVTIAVNELPSPGDPARPAAGTTVTLDLFTDVSIVAEFERFDPNAYGTTWVGRVAGVPESRVTLVYSDGRMTASVVMPDRTYAIRPTSSNLHLALELDQSGMRQELPAIEVPASALAAAPVDPGPQEDSADTIDLLVVYTPAAQAGAGGAAAIVNLINLGVSETNSAYASSGVTQRLRLVHVAPVPYAEVDAIGTNLSNLRTGAGTLSDVPALRNTYAADLVMLVENAVAPSGCGVAYLMNPVGASFQAFAFSVVEYDCISPNYSFAHELGHNMGLNHDWYVNNSLTPFTYGHGHVSTVVGNRWRTIMSYNDLCASQGFNCTRQLRFSNPAIQINGVPTGIPAGTNSTCSTGSPTSNQCDAHEQLALNNTALTVANFRQALVGAFGKVTPASGAIVVAPSVNLTWQAAPNATSYEYCVDTTNNDACDQAWTSAGGSLNASIGAMTAGTTYYWQVRGVNASGSTTADGGAWRSFRVAPAANVNVIVNGGFDSGTNNWSFFATPDMSYIVSNVTGGVLQYYRQPPPPGTQNQAVAFQQTGMPLAAGAPLVAQFTLGNSDAVRKRISVLIHDSDFSDLAVCTFWLPANAPLSPYAMRTHASRAWANATMSFYAASAGSGGGFYRVDNVSLAYAPAQSSARTDCVDPLAPAATGDPDGPELLLNGDFASGTLPPWTVFGQLVGQVTSGVFEFYRPAPAADPAGVVFQPTGSPFAARDVMTAQLDLGNSSAVRKRVTVLLHDLNFGDLTACTFWLPAGQPLSTYAVRSYSTQAWANATLSVYAATAGPETWIRLDNVSFRKSPGVTISGTDCLEPGESDQLRAPRIR